MSFWSLFLRPFRPSLPDLFAESEEGFVNATFRILRHARESDGSNVFQVRASYGGKPVGFVVDVSPDWRGDTLGEGIPVYWGSVRYRSLGHESHAFLRALASAYGAPTCSQMAPVIQFAAIALKGNPMTFADGSVDMKLFFESEDEDRYAEVYTNLHPAQGLAEVREKDNGYRAPLLLALSAGAA